MMPSGSSEANVVRTYIDWIIKTPWFEETQDNEDILEVERILNEDHFGLEKLINLIHADIFDVEIDFISTISS